MGFLAIVAAALTLVPLLFPVFPEQNELLEWGQWLIIFLFALEYGLSLARARSKIAFLLNKWRMIDAATILVPILTLIPGGSNLFRSAPVLRLVRLARVISLGARASGVIVRKEITTVAAQRSPPVQIHMLPSTQGQPRAATWEEFLRCAKQPNGEWYSIANVGHDNIAQLAAAIDISKEFISSRLLGTSYPQLDTTGAYLSLFAWMPQIQASGSTERIGLLLLASKTGIVTFSRRPASILEKITELRTADVTLPFPVCMVCEFLRVVLDANEQLVGQFEQQLGTLEDLPIRDSRPQFFEHTFRLKKELSAAQADLWRLRGVLSELADSRVKLPGQDGNELPVLHALAETVDYLYETVNNIREGVLSLIELHLNVVSFEMNRVMRLLAVVSVLGLIPAVVGGLFGMNLVGNPWPLTLPQVTFAVCFTMITCLYFFVVKGWLR